MMIINAHLYSGRITALSLGALSVCCVLCVRLPRSILRQSRSYNNATGHYNHAHFTDEETKRAAIPARVADLVQISPQQFELSLPKLRDF